MMIDGYATPYGTGTGTLYSNFKIYTQKADKIGSVLNFRHGNIYVVPVLF